MAFGITRPRKENSATKPTGRSRNSKREKKRYPWPKTFQATKIRIQAKKEKKNRTFGKMAPATPKSTNKSKSQSVADTDSNLDYLLLLMATSSADFKPDYHAVAKEVGISSANTA